MLDPAILQFFERIGAPVAIVFAIVYVCWRIVRWIGDKIIEPHVKRLVDELIVFVRSVGKTNETLADAVQQIQRDTTEHARLLDERLRENNTRR